MHMNSISTSTWMDSVLPSCSVQSLLTPSGFKWTTRTCWPSILSENRHDPELHPQPPPNTSTWLRDLHPNSALAPNLCHRRDTGIPSYSCGPFQTCSSQWPGAGTSRELVLPCDTWGWILASFGTPFYIMGSRGGIIQKTWENQYEIVL